MITVLFPDSMLFWSLFFRMALNDGQDSIQASCSAWDQLLSEETKQCEGYDPYLDAIRPAVGALACHDLGGLL